MNRIVEMHEHIVCTAEDRRSWYCGFVYMDGKQCDARWWMFPNILTEYGSRTFTREAVRAWVKAGGIL